MTGRTLGECGRLLTSWIRAGQWNARDTKTGASKPLTAWDANDVKGAVGIFFAKYGSKIHKKVTQAKLCTTINANIRAVRLQPPSLAPGSTSEAHRPKRVCLLLNTCLTLQESRKLKMHASLLACATPSDFIDFYDKHKWKNTNLRLTASRISEFPEAVRATAVKVAKLQASKIGKKKRGPCYRPSVTVRHSTIASLPSMWQSL